MNPIALQIMDYSFCVDAMWQEEVCNELYEAGMQNDKLALLYDINCTNHIKRRRRYEDKSFIISVVFDAHFFN